MSTPQDDSFDETQVMNAFGVAMNANKPRQWHPPTPEELQLLLPGYQIDKLLGRGGMGAVYRGVQKKLDRPVAVKILPPRLGGSARNPCPAVTAAGVAAKRRRGCRVGWEWGTRRRGGAEKGRFPAESQRR